MFDQHLFGNDLNSGCYGDDERPPDVREFVVCVDSGAKVDLLPSKVSRALHKSKQRRYRPAATRHNLQLDNTKARSLTVGVFLQAPGIPKLHHAEE